MKQQHAQPRLTAAMVLLSFGLGYFLSFFYRTVNAVVGPEIARSLALSAADLGLITGTYFIAFAGFQIPLGILLDRYGARRVEAALLLCAAGGALVFAFGQTTTELAVGRGLIGFGVSSCLMAAIKANVEWWPKERLPLVNGIILAMGGLGAIVATSPVQQALLYLNWRGVFIGLAGVTVGVAALILLVVPNAPARRRGGEHWAAAFKGAVSVFGHAGFISIAPLATLSQASFLAYHGLWAAVWMRDVEGIDPPDVAAVLALATTGIIVGTLGAGLAADRLGRRGVPTLNVALAGSIAYMLVQLGLVAQVSLPSAFIWWMFCLFGMTGTLYFSVLAQAFPPESSGRALTALNMLFFVSAFLLQWLVGVLLPIVAGTAGDLVSAHRTLLGSILILHVAALAWFGLRRGRRFG